ncbi:MAG: hypothetical protein JSW54_02940 [Fidelibacterota bacterium]|nr:MAG: hypothetical protein JSW54_02940 [Candidatus Neomarinimicrobiota bacterium]
MMRSSLKIALLTWLLISPASLITQEHDPSPEADRVLNHLRERFDRIEDYQVNLEVSLDMPMLRMPRKRMTFSFKQPDKTRLEARGFAMVPRRGLALSPDSLLHTLHDLEVVTGDTLIDGHPSILLQGFEEGPDNLRLLAEVIVDREIWVVRAITTRQEEKEIFRIQIDYLEVAPGLYMPEETRLAFQLNERFLRGRYQGRGASFDPDIPAPIVEEGQDMTGEASIRFSNYRVNHGIADSYFEDDGDQ